MNSIGNFFKVNSFGESHGNAVGCIIEGLPAGLILNLEAIQKAVDKRKTSQNQFASQRKESDKVEIISGFFEGKTLGSPLCILIKNEDAQSKDYADIKHIFRPGHADYSNQIKYGFRDYRGGGRSSIRITAPLVAAGEIASQLLSHYSKAQIHSFVSGIGLAHLNLENFFKQGLSADEKKYLNTNKNNFTQEAFEQDCTEQMENAKKHLDTLGGKITCLIENLEPGIGEPIFGKLQAALAQAIFSINTVRALEFGNGIQIAQSKGSENNDPFFMNEQNEIQTINNHHAGILGGISTGEQISFSVYLKPISSIGQKQKSIDEQGEEVAFTIQGRHDSCAVPRATSIVKAYTQIVLCDLFLHNRYAKI